MHKTSDLHQQLLSMDRRTFLLILGSAAAAFPLSVLAKRRAVAVTGGALSEPWRTLEAVMEQLLPAEPDSPGARDIGAVAYLRSMLQARDVPEDDRRFIFDGVGWLDDLAKNEHAADFIALNPGQREDILRTIAQSRAGERWLSTLLTWVLEALLSDPVYGGNPNSIGWKWLQHPAGYPTPPPEKMYFKLGYMVHKRTKS